MRAALLTSLFLWVACGTEQPHLDRIDGDVVDSGPPDTSTADAQTEGPDATPGADTSPPDAGPPENPICGHLGQSCCNFQPGPAADACANQPLCCYVEPGSSPGLACIGAMCHPCGGLNERCCPGQDVYPCEGNLACGHQSPEPPAGNPVCYMP